MCILLGYAFFNLEAGQDGERLGALWITACSGMLL